MQQHVLLGGQGDDDHGKFRALRFMDGDGISQRQFIELAELVSDETFIVLDTQFSLGGVDFCDVADVAIENFFIIIVLGLNDFIADAKDGAKFFHGRVLRPGGIELGLEAQVQFTNAEGAAVHGAEHLGIAHGMETEFFGNAVFDDVQQRIDDGLRLVALDEIEIRIDFFFGDFGQEAFVNTMGIGDDVAVGGLAKHFPQAGDGQNIAFDEALQNAAGTD